MSDHPLTKALRYRVDGMDCAGCATTIETALGRLPGVSDLRVNFMAGSMTLSLDERATPTGDLERKLRALGYEPFAIGAAAVPAERNAAEGARESCCGHGQNRHDHHGHNHGPTTTSAAELHAPAHAHAVDDARPWWSTRKGRRVLMLGALVGAASALAVLFPPLSEWAFAAAALIGVAPFARKALISGIAGAPFGIETLMSVAAVGALAIGAASEAAIVVLLFAVGELLEGVAAQRARSGVRALSALLPRRALVEENGALRSVDAAALRPGQILVVRPGDRVATDGDVIEGASSLDESPVTGESVPIARDVGDPVQAGSINIDAPLRVRVSRAAEDNTIARIIRQVEEAQAAKAPIARFIDDFSRWYTPSAMLVAAFTAVAPPLLFGEPWTVWIYRSLALLLIACPCALVLSTPAAIASGIAAATRRGLLIKSGAALEALARVRVVAFDKTGTLTEGAPRVVDILALDVERKPDDVLRLAAAVESHSGHPIGRAILDAAAARSLTLPPVENGTMLAGRGVSALVENRRISVTSPRHAAEIGLLAEAGRAAAERLETSGKTVVAVSDETGAFGLIAVRDEPRADARAGLAALSKLGIRPVMLSGDNRRTAAAIGADLGLEARSELLPEDKLRAVATLSAEGPTAMVGDGINDAPALAAARVGIAMGGGTDVALETADAALLRNRVTGVAELLALARATLANIRQNIVIALGLKALFLATSIAGATSLWMAILADTGATVLVTANAMRLLGFRFRSGVENNPGA